MSEVRYDDRLDTASALSTGGVLAIFRRSLEFLWPERRLFAARLGLIVLILAAGLPLPWFLKIVVDHGVFALPITEDVLYPFFMEPVLSALAPLDPIEITLYACLALAGFFFLFGYAGNARLDAYLAEGADVATKSENRASDGASSAQGVIGVIDLAVHIRLSQRISHAVRVGLFRQLSRLPMTSLAEQRSGDAIFRVMHDTPSVAGICLGLTMHPFFMLASVVTGLWILTIVYGAVAPELVWIGLSAVVLTLVCTMPFAGWARSASQRSRASGSATTNKTEEGLKQAVAIQSLGGSDHERVRFDAASRESFRQSLLLVWVLRIVEWVSEHVHLVFQTAGFWFIFDGIIKGTLTLGDAPVVLRMYSLLYETSMSFGRIWIDQQENAAAARRVFFVSDHVAASALERPDPGLPRVRFAEPCPVVFERVGFSYPGGVEVLQDVSFEIGAGETLAVVGPTGAGKTTLAYMLPKFVAPTDGRVLVDGHDLAEIDTGCVREQISYVFQEHQLLTGSVADNLRLARPDASPAELEAALRLAGAWEFVSRLPDGLDAFVGQGGRALSTGQKQRLSIARGFLRRTPILVLDEPSAALDPQSEAALVDAMLDPGRTSIVIAHRLSTIRHADRIIVLDGGRVVEQGSHAELVDRQGRYAALVEAQTATVAKPTRSF